MNNKVAVGQFRIRVFRKSSMRIGQYPNQQDQNLVFLFTNIDKSLGEYSSSETLIEPLGHEPKAKPETLRQNPTRH